MGHSFHPSATQILTDRYLLKDERGQVFEEIEELPHRIAWGVAQDIDDIPVYEEMIRNGRFLPNSPTIANAGRGADKEKVLRWLRNKKAGDTLSPQPKRGGQLSACFVLPIFDNMRSIFTTLTNTALIHQTGGGTGFNWSRLRYEGALVLSSGGRASGPRSFMKVYDQATGELKQGGFRRGANMGVLNARHKDIRKFITCKADTSQITNFNISVAADDEFMLKALDDSLTPEQRRYELWDFEKNEPLRDVDGNVLTEDAKEVFDLLCEQAHKTGEPGLLFWTTIINGNPLGDAAPIEATNPCGEQPLPANGSCVLGSMNVSAHVLPDGSDYDWILIDGDAATGLRFLDDVIDSNMYTLPEILERAMSDRRVGLGIMGFAHSLIKLGVRYGSEESFEIADRLMGRISVAARKESERLGIERGSFPLFEQSVYPSLGYRAMRNGTHETIAPTGTISTMLQVTSGCEPMYALAYTRKVVGGDPIQVVEPLFLEALKNEGIYSEQLVQKVIDNHGSCQGIDEIPAHIQNLFVTAHDITPEEHVRMQTTFQKHVNSAISKTINMSESATVDDVRKAYAQAWREGAKGITVYRNNSRPNQTLQVGTEANPATVALQEKVLSILVQMGEDADVGIAALVVEEYLKSKAGRSEQKAISDKDLTECPVCSAPTKHEDHCTSCSDPECGWSACSIA